jgi:homeobox protein HLX1
MSNSAPFANINPYHHSIMRLPTIAQLSPNNSVTQFYNQKISKSSTSEAKAQQNSTSNGGSNVKRKRSWSRAVFSNLQRKGLERQFEFQKYITKPDRKKLAARLGLKDAQVKVWFQVSFSTQIAALN